MDFIAIFGSSYVSAMITPFPRARPSALITIGIFCLLTYSNALFISLNISYFAVGILYFLINSLEKALLPSIIAAALFGPKHGIPRSESKSTRPSTRGSSGATTA